MSKDLGPIPRISEMVRGYKWTPEKGLIAERTAQLEALPPEPHDCPHGHGPMEPRPLNQQTYEQLFCGLWWDCKKGCQSAQLVLSRDCAYQNGEPYRTPGGEWERFDGTAWVAISDEEAEAFRTARLAWEEETTRRALRAARSRKRAKVA